MKLYELTNDFAQLFDRVDEISELDGDTETYQQAWFDTLSGIEEEFEVKAENIGAYIKALTAAAKDLKAEESALSKRRKAKEKQIYWLKKYLLESMQAIGRTKIDRPMAVLSVKNCPESVKFQDEKAFVDACMESGHDEYLRYKMPEIDRTVVREVLQRGNKSDSEYLTLAGAYLARDQRIDIK